MSVHTVRFTLRLGHLNWRQRLWFWRLRITPPLAQASTGSEEWARLVPYRWRAFHHRYATRHGYFWLPCVLCGRPFGGHESGDSIPDPTGPTGAGICICSQCTPAGRGWHIPHPIEGIIDGIYERGEHGHGELTPGCPSCELIDAEIRHAFTSYKEPET